MSKLLGILDFDGTLAETSTSGFNRETFSNLLYYLQKKGYLSGMEISRENVIKIFKGKNAYQALLDAGVPGEAIQDAFQFSGISDKNVPLFPYAESILFGNREKIDPLVVSDNFERAVEKVLQGFPSSKIIASSHMGGSKVSFIQKMSPDFFQDTETCVVVGDTNTDYKLAKNIQGHILTYLLFLFRYMRMNHNFHDEYMIFSFVKC